MYFVFSTTGFQHIKMSKGSKESLDMLLLNRQKKISDRFITHMWFCLHKHIYCLPVISPEIFYIYGSFFNLGLRV
jgi:hypothetical protein